MMMSRPRIRIPSRPRLGRHNDSSVAVPPPCYGEYDDGDMEKLRELAGHDYLLKDPERKVVTMTEFSRFSSFSGCKILVGVPLPVGTVHVTHTTPLEADLGDVLEKTKLVELGDKPDDDIK
ncbi:hypothetical protein Tco_0940021 [Tanacetum coccineum]|uniref:Uncharacterized protein n=1 Tax=Tanacetum coccineum TaxID=301880 RepID=A0ABQ5DPF0_9ASTR